MNKILVVDDDKDMLLLLEHSLSRKGYEVKTLSSGRFAQDAVYTFSPDLVILDINLGDADGRVVCQKIKSTPKFADLPVILYSAEQFPDSSIADCKGSVFIRKPFKSTSFLDQVDHLIAM